MLPLKNLDGTTMVLAGCWPNNALGEPELAYILSPYWTSSCRRLRFPAAAEVPLRAKERERLLLGIELPFYTSLVNQTPPVHRPFYAIA